MPTITKKVAPKELVPEGTHIARCYKFMHLGTILNNFNELRDTVRFTFELPYETREFKEGEGEEPMSISMDFTNFLGSQTKLKQMLETWRGQAFTVEELEGFDLENAVGAPCQVTISHKTSKAGNKYEAITAITALPKGTKAPDPVNQNFIWNYNTRFDLKVLENMHEYWQDLIRSSVEYKEALGLNTELIPDNNPPDEAPDPNFDDLPF